MVAEQVCENLNMLGKRVLVMRYMVNEVESGNYPHKFNKDELCRNWNFLKTTMNELEPLMEVFLGEEARV